MCMNIKFALKTNIASGLGGIMGLMLIDRWNSRVFIA